MKSTFFKTVKQEKSMELKTDIKKLIKRLQSLENRCYTPDGNDNCLDFFCSDKGRLSVSGLHESKSLSSIRSTYTIGQLEEKDGKTLLKIYSVNDRSAIITKYITIIIYAIMFIFMIIDTFLSGNGISIKEIFGVFLGVLLVIVLFSDMHSEQKNSDSDLKIMTEEIERRVTAAERWDD